ncbi:MAG TPA: hypothetical protein VKN74_04495, partial [Candidatus Mcinerneyibacterium sp.]|nr:hypothetical protein [Candidatus Mcinerneyibacterium sp.]
MFKRIIAFLIILFLVLFSFGCGDSTSSSMNTVPEATFLPNFNASVDDLQTGASGTGFYNDGFYEDIFGQNSGILSLFNFYLNFYTQFKNNAEYNSEESRWEASFENGELLVYGEFSNGVFVITSPDLTGITINLYPNEGSITVNIDGKPDFLDPNIRAELYK